jgi:hypothetical protein
MMWKLAEDTTSDKGSPSAEDAVASEKERILSVMPAPGHKFHNLAKKFLSADAGDRGFPSPYLLAYRDGRLIITQV